MELAVGSGGTWWRGTRHVVTWHVAAWHVAGCAGVAAACWGDRNRGVVQLQMAETRVVQKRVRHGVGGSTQCKASLARKKGTGMSCKPAQASYGM